MTKEIIGIWEKVGGGTFVTKDRKVLKKGEKFKGKLSDIPKAFQGSFKLVEEVKPEPVPEKEPETTPEKEPETPKVTKKPNKGGRPKKGH